MADETKRQRKVALQLMRMALPLLDRAGEGLAAAQLQHAIDAAEHSPPAQSGEREDRWEVVTPRPDRGAPDRPGDT